MAAQTITLQCQCSCHMFDLTHWIVISQTNFWFIWFVQHNCRIIKSKMFWAKDTLPLSFAWCTSPLEQCLPWKRSKSVSLCFFRFRLKDLNLRSRFLWTDLWDGFQISQRMSQRSLAASGLSDSYGPSEIAIICVHTLLISLNQLVFLLWSLYQRALYCLFSSALATPEYCASIRFVHGCQRPLPHSRARWWWRSQSRHPGPAWLGAEIRRSWNLVCYMIWGLFRTVNSSALIWSCLDFVIFDWFSGGTWIKSWPLCSTCTPAEWCIEVGCKLRWFWQFLFFNCLSLCSLCDQTSNQQMFFWLHLAK